LKGYNGKFFYNQDNPVLKKVAGQYQNTITFGTNQGSLKGELIHSPPFVNVKVNFKKGILYLNTHLAGTYNFENIMAAACIGNYFKVDPLKIQKALKDYQPQNNRSQLIRKGNLKIIMDAYNANPTSMQASVKSFLTDYSGDSYLVLGDMLELGDYSKQEHKAILELINELKPKDAFLVGSIFFMFSKEYNFKFFADVLKLNSFLAKKPIKNGNILIKGSRGIKLEKSLEYFS
jgi:UDP-N-acetylmuramoyl-tripeptide--D-alanyl-D-alanine ligase